MTAAIGIDVGGTTIKSGLVSESGEFLSRHVSPTPKDLALLVGQLRQHVERHDSYAQAHGLDVAAAVGVVVPGIVDETRGQAVLSANLGWEDVPMRDLASRAFGRPVALGHDVRAGAAAEFQLLPKNQVQLYLALGTGMAAVMRVHDRVLVNGGWAGEVGHALVLDPDTGARVPLERVVSASAIVNRYQALTGTTLIDGSREVFERAEAGDDTAQNVITVCIEYLAEMLAQLCCLFGPLDIVIGGGLSLATDRLLQPLLDEVESLLSISPAPRITLAQLGDSSQIIGASQLARTSPQVLESVA